MKKSILLLAVFIMTLSLFAQDQWKIDPAHSSLNFNISHSGISIVNGKFLDYTGDLTIDDDAYNSANIDFLVKVKSINTNVEMRDDHLRSDDFFDVKKFPNMSFKSTKILATGKPDYYLLHGELTIKDVTKNVIFDVHFGGVTKNDDGDRIGIKAETQINRFDYNIDYDPTATGIAKDVAIIVHGQFAKQ